MAKTCCMYMCLYLLKLGKVYGQELHSVSMFEFREMLTEMAGLTLGEIVFCRTQEGPA